MRPLALCLIVLLLGVPFQVRAEGGEAPPEPTVTFNAVHKISGRSFPLKIPTGAFSSYDKLQIFPSRCIKTVDNGEISYAALLEIYETSLSKTPTKLFSGWLFSNSHSITNLENQYYDLVLESCELPEENIAPAADEAETLTPETPTEQMPAPEQTYETEEPESLPLD